MVRVNGTENRIDVLVRDRHTDVVTSKELVEELAEFASVKEGIVVVVVLSKVLHDLLVKLNFVVGEVLKLGKGGVKLAFLEICWVDHLLKICLSFKVIKIKNLFTTLPNLNKSNPIPISNF